MRDDRHAIATATTHLPVRDPLLVLFAILHAQGQGLASPELEPLLAHLESPASAEPPVSGEPAALLVDFR